jgi:hypothetical protein
MRQSNRRGLGGARSCASQGSLRRTFGRSVADYIPFSEKLNERLAALALWLGVHAHDAGIILGLNAKESYNPLLDQD